MRSQAPAFGDVFELHVTLLDIDPPIWRALRVPAEVRLDLLHHALQTAFGWTDSHLHAFFASDIRFGMADVEDELFSVDERAAPLGAIARRGSRFLYEYDFGDDWRHEIHVERVDSEHDEIIRCIGGARACPPEDCGGPHGYAHLLEVLDNPAHEEHAEMKQWAPRRFNPERFDVNVVNRKLAALSRRAVRAHARR